jgi:hypothetical protein
VNSSHCFTQKARKRLQVLRTPVSISLPFNPGTINPHQHPRAAQFEAIWDTGATATAISEAVVAACGLKPVGMVRAQTPAGTMNCEGYVVNLTVNHKVTFPWVHVTKANLGPNTGVLIGMDVITLGDFAVTNKDGQTCFSFRYPAAEWLEFREIS